MKLNKKQKRTATIASMAALLAVVLGMGGQTFAKYITTQDVGTTQATVAKWGYVINANVTKLFDTTYGTDSDADKMLEAGTDGTSVVTTGTTSVVAPGTEGFMTLVISGKAEVKSAITVAVADEAANLTAPTAKAKDIYLDSYHPLKWTITNKGAATTVTNGTLADVETYLEGLTDAEIAANEEIDYNLNISWAWDFDDNGAGTNDVLDTRLADLKTLSSDKYDEKYGENAYSTDNSKSSLTLSFAMSVKVVQIQ